MDAVRSDAVLCIRTWSGPGCVKSEIGGRLGLGGWNATMRAVSTRAAEAALGFCFVASCSQNRLVDANW
jgi:hypothetical protein